MVEVGELVGKAVWPVGLSVEWWKGPFRGTELGAVPSVEDGLTAMVLDVRVPEADITITPEDEPVAAVGQVGEGVPEPPKILNRPE